MISSFGIRGDVVDKRAPTAGRHLSITWEKNEMACVAIYLQPSAGSRKTDPLLAKFTRGRPNGLATLLLLAGLLGLSTQLYAATACTRVDDGGWWCWEYDDYNVGFSQDGGGGPSLNYSGGYYVGVDGTVGGLEITNLTLPIPRRDSERNVGCSDATPIRKEYARFQIAPFMSILRIGQRVRISYPTGQSEKFLIECKICSLPAVPVAGTCG